MVRKKWAVNVTGQNEIWAVTSQIWPVSGAVTGPYFESCQATTFYIIDHYHRMDKNVDLRGAWFLRGIYLYAYKNKHVYPKKLKICPIEVQLDQIWAF